MSRFGVVSEKNEENNGGKATRILAFSTPRLEEARFSFIYFNQNNILQQAERRKTIMRGSSCHLLSQIFKKTAKV